MHLDDLDSTDPFDCGCWRIGFRDCGARYSCLSCFLFWRKLPIRCRVCSVSKHVLSQTLLMFKISYLWSMHKHNRTE
jgi:hypothetical protein